MPLWRAVATSPERHIVLPSASVTLMLYDCCTNPRSAPSTCQLKVGAWVSTPSGLVRSFTRRLDNTMVALHDSEAAKAITISHNVDILVFFMSILQFSI